MADVALISVITSGTVGALGSLGALNAQRVTVRLDNRKRKDERIADIRSVLDEAVQLAMQVNLPVEDGVTTLRGVANEIDKTVFQMDRQLGRIGVRLGPESAAYVTYGALRNAISVLWTTITALPDVALSAHSLQDQGFPPQSAAAVNSAFRGIEGKLEEFLRASVAACASSGA